MKSLAAVCLLSALLLGCANPGGNSSLQRDRHSRPPATLAAPENLDDYLALLRPRLHLSPEQEEQVRPILQWELERRAELKQRYASLDPKDRARQLNPELRRLQDDTAARLDAILFPVQLDRLRQVQEEMIGRSSEGSGGRGGGRRGGRGSSGAGGDGGY